MLDPRLRHLVAVARSGSFTAGAAAAGVTQSAATKSVADLEREIGYRIFTRTARGVVLTERGAYFAERAAMLLDDARDLMDPRVRKDVVFGGILRIGVAPAAIEWCIVEPLVRLRRNHPAIRVEASAGSFDHVVQQLRSGALDIAIGMGAAFDGWTDLHAETFASFETTPFVRCGHPLTEAASYARADLSRYDFISPSVSRPYGDIIRQVYTDQGVPWQDRVHVIDHFPAVTRLVASSDAIGVVHKPYAARPAFAERFVALERVELFPPGPLSSAIRSRWEPKPSARAFISSLQAVGIGGAETRAVVPPTAAHSGPE